MHYFIGYGRTPVPSQDELQAFKNGKDVGPTMKSFHLDLASESLTSKWNARAAEIFADVFLQEDLAEILDRDAVISAFVVHLITLQKIYRKPFQCAKMTEAELDGKRDKEKLKARDQQKCGV